MRSKFSVVFALVLIASMLLGACQSAQPTAAPAEPQVTTIVQTVEVEVEGETIIITATPSPTEEPAAGPKVLRANFGAGDVPTLDPGVAEDTSSITVVDAVTVGLTRLDNVTTEIKPGLADSWDISEDGLVYTFHLRSDVPWVKYDGTEVVKVQDCEGNDRMVTADDFAYGIQRALAPATASPYAYVLAFVVKGAAEYNAGETEDASTIGVKVIDPQTLEVTFLQPAAYNANIIGMWTAHAAPKWLIEGDDCTEARGDRWIEPGFYQTYGPFTLKEWIHDSTLTMIKNPFWPGSEAIPQPKLDEVTFSMLDQTAAFAEYEAGNMDWVEPPLADLDRIKADPVLSAEFKTGVSNCTYFYGYNTKAPIVDDPRVRLALSEAVDRQSLIDNVTKGGQEPAQWFSRPGLAGSPTMADHPDLGVKYDPEHAKQLLDEYLAEKGQTADQLDLSLVYNTSSGHQAIAEAIQQMWADNLGVNVKVVNQEWKVFLETIKDPVNTPQIWRLGWCMDYPDANNFLKEVTGVGGSSNPPGGGGFNWENEEFEALLTQAAAEQDPAKRVELYAQAEEILVKTDAVMIPIYWYTALSVTKPYVERTYSVTGHQSYEFWDLKPQQ